MTAVVSLRSVSRTYRNGAVAVTAVRNVSFDIHQGERLAIMGPSGSGKSTLMNMIGLLDRPSEGAILLEGTDVSSLSEDEKSRLRAQKIGFIFQAYNLLARYSAIENVALPQIYSGVGRHERLRRWGCCTGQAIFRASSLAVNSREWRSPAHSLDPPPSCSPTNRPAL